MSEQPLSVELVTLALCCGHHLACHDWHEDGWGHQGCGHKDCTCSRTFSQAYAARMAQARAEALCEAADALPDITEGGARIGTSTWSEPARDIYSLAIEEAQGALRERASGLLFPPDERT